MTRMIQAELTRLLRRRTVLALAAAAVLFAVLATLNVFSSATATGDPSLRGGTSLASLAGAGGGTKSFAVGASFIGFFVFVTFIALVATEFSGGTFRALLLRQPDRRRVVLGKLAAALLVAAGVVALAEASTFALSLAVAPTKGVPTGAWLSLHGIGAGLGDYGTVLGGVAGWAVFGTALGVVFRSAPLALGVGFAWAGPFENIVAGSWSPGLRFFPGQVLAALIRGGTGDVGLGRAVLTAVLYTAVAAAGTLALVSRRDVTA